MSNLSTLPKGDSAWLLRKAIERIIQQVSVLETNIGSSTTGNSANTQVIFNDNGVLRGDPDLIFNTALNRLIATNLESTAALTVGTSATITGDLTVATSVLKVDSANTRVGINTTTINGGPFNVKISSAIDAKFVVQDGFTTGNVRLAAVDNAYSTYKIMDYSALSHAWYNSGSTAMTLNSTGLGVGASPTAKLHVSGTGTQTLRVETLTSGNPTLNLLASGQDTCSILYDRSNNYMRFDVSSVTGALILSRDGNVGVGVTPSAWATTTTVWRALDMQYSCGLASSGAGSGEIDLLWNAYYDQTDQRWEFKYTGDRASRYSIGGAGVHAWYNTASTGTANGAITWTQAMTLDASGNLSVGTTNPAAVFGTVRSGFVATGASGAIGAKVDATGRACLIAWNADTAGDNNFIQFFTEATLTSRGSITYNRGAGQVAYNITSDYRLKEDIKPLTGAVNRIASLKPSTYKLKETGSACEGFIAHELAEVVPMAVTGAKDAVDSDGKPLYQAVDLSKIVPVLVAAIQELAAEVNALKNA